MINSSGLGENAFSPVSLLNESEFEIAYILSVLGIDLDAIDSITIDEIVDSIKSMFDYKKVGSISEIESSYRMLKQQGNSILRHARKSWFSLCFAKAVIENG